GRERTLAGGAGRASNSGVNMRPPPATNNQKTGGGPAYRSDRRPPRRTEKKVGGQDRISPCDDDLVVSGRLAPCQREEILKGCSGIHHGHSFGRRESTIPIPKCLRCQKCQYRAVEMFWNPPHEALAAGRDDDECRARDVLVDQFHGPEWGEHVALGG